MTVTIYPAVKTVVDVGGQPITCMYGPLSGGLIVNPYSAGNQGIGVAETLYVCLNGDAGLAENVTTFAIQPGGLFKVPAGNTTNVSINAASTGHRFSAIAFQPGVIYVPQTGSFPPDGPTTVTKTIPAYLYTEYNDDDDLQAFFRAFNELAQEDIDFFVDTGLPIYTGLSGSLLDFVAAGLYGMLRPALPAGTNPNVGPLNTWAPNVVAPNQLIIVGNSQYFATTDDVFKRILTWHFYKGDGKVFDIRWLKRRIMRFLIGIDGTSPNIDETYRVSITFAARQANIRILPGIRTIVDGAIPNLFAPNAVAPNSLSSTFEPFPALAFAPILKAGIDSGVLELPFQFTYAVTV